MNTATHHAVSLRSPWTAVPSLGNLDAYLGAVNRLPMLTADEELSLARRLRDQADVSAAGQLVISHLRLVVSVSRQYRGYGLPQGDLIQEGNVGLMKAVRRFDPEQGVRLVSYALHWIKAEIHEDILRNWRMVKAQVARHQVRWQWVRGHSGIALNERVDQIARECLERGRAGGLAA